MQVVTDEQRREVAERLRGLRRDAHNVTQLNHGPTWSLAWCVLGDGLDECGTGDWFERMCARLADLIDPDCEEGRYEGLRTVRPVDRDALLAMADEMKRMPQCELCPAEIVDCSAHPDGCPGALLDYYARRIREACGEAVA